MMLWITREEKPGDRATTLRLEGSVGAGWGALLECECSGLIRDGVAVSLDLAGVHLVDLSAVETLRRLARDGVEIHCRCGIVADVLEAEGVRITLMPGGGA
jgi:hypothetical protein